MLQSTSKRAFKEAGFDEKQAAVLSEMMSEIFSVFATKQDLAMVEERTGRRIEVLGTELRGEISLLRAEMSTMRADMATRAEISKMRADMATRADMSKMRAEMFAMRGQMSEMRGEMATRAEMSSTRAEMSTMRGEMSTMRGEMSAMRGEMSTMESRLLTAIEKSAKEQTWKFIALVAFMSTVLGILNYVTA